MGAGWTIIRGLEEKGLALSMMAFQNAEKVQAALAVIAAPFPPVSLSPSGSPWPIETEAHDGSQY
jgi:hypothetical protein